MSQQHFNSIVVGSGTSAWFSIKALSDAGQKVAVVDERPYGGTCALRGCQPKKYLVANAEAVASVNHLVGKGIRNSVSTDWSDLQDLKNEFLSGRSVNEVKEWEKAGVITFHDHAVMTSENTVQVGSETLTADNIIIATGAKPRRSEIPGSEYAKVSEDFLELASLPDRILFIGGGYISFEFAHVAIRAGAKEVIILHRSSRALKNFESDMVDIVVKASREEGINVVFNESAEAIERRDDSFVVTSSASSKYEVDLVIEATGRIPNVSVVGEGNVVHSSKGIEVNEYMQSVSNPRVYAIGDVTASSTMLAPVADAQGKAAARNILDGNTVEVALDVVPSAVFTIPSMASVGMSEESVRAENVDFRINQGETTAWPSSKRIGEKHAGYKIIIDNKTDLILGAHIVRHGAADVINTFALAIKHGIKAKELAEFPWAYPTMSSDLKYMVR